MMLQRDVGALPENKVDSANAHDVRRFELQLVQPERAAATLARPLHPPEPWRRPVDDRATIVAPRGLVITAAVALHPACR